MRSPAVRSTRQRRLVEAAVDSSEEFRSAQEIHELLRRDGERVGLATVYRALQTMVENHEVDVLKTAAGEAVYRRCSTRHHHHLVCRSCGKTVEIEGPAVESWADEVAGAHGFRDVQPHRRALRHLPRLPPGRLASRASPPRSSRAVRPRRVGPCAPVESGPEDPAARLHRSGLPEG